MSDPSLDLFWPKDLVGRTLGEHQMKVSSSGFPCCRSCNVVVRDYPQHVMQALLEAVEKLRSGAPTSTLPHKTTDWVEPDRRESSIVWEKPGGDAA